MIKNITMCAQSEPLLGQVVGVGLMAAGLVQSS